MPGFEMSIYIDFSSASEIIITGSIFIYFKSSNLLGD